MQYEAEAAKPPELDATDRRLLDLLQDDCSLSNQQLAERAHLTPSTCLRRVRRLVESGVIARSIAVLDPQRLRRLNALVEVTLEDQTAEALQAFEQRAVAEPAVQQCWRVSTGPDFVLVIDVADMPAYHALAHRLFTAANRVRNVRAFFAVHCAKFAPKVMLDTVG